MISHDEMMGIVATEAAEAAAGSPPRTSSEDLEMSALLVRWKDRILHRAALNIDNHMIDGPVEDFTEEEKGFERGLRTAVDEVCKLMADPSYWSRGAPSSLAVTACSERPLSVSVEKLEKRAKEFEELIGEMFATLHVNRLRGTITSVDEPDFDRVIAAWKRRFEAAQNDKLTDGSAITNHV